MTRRMLINALYPEECRVAVADDDKLLELEVERTDSAQLKGNIYKAPITRIEPSLQAAFLDIGSNRNGFLQINDINPSYYNDWTYQEGWERNRPSIQNVLRAGQDLVVQVVKDERAAKGATLTTNLSIPGRYLVLMVGNQRGGVSRKISDEGQRRRLRQAVQSLKVPVGMGVIVRTAGINKSSIELQRDLDALLELWFDIISTSRKPGGPIALYKESNLAVRTLRDYLTSDIEEILIDEKETYESAREFVGKTLPGYVPKIKYFDRPQPLFTSYHLDPQIEEINQPEVTLPSGGSIVINITEAVVAIDVNSGRSTGQADVEETAFATNKEAAVALAKQLRLRDLGGLVIVDFIDMIDRRHKQTVEKVLKDSVKGDKAKIEVGRISKFGLLEMSRQRLKSSLVSQSHATCLHCLGRGRVRNPESAALEVLRKIQSAVFAGGVDVIRCHMSPAAALLLLNEKRQMLSQFEEKSNTKIYIFADGRKKPDEYDLELATSKSDETIVVQSQTPQTRSGGQSPGGERRDRRASGGGDNSRSRNRRRGTGGRDRRGRPSRNNEEQNHQANESSDRGGNQAERQGHGGEENSRPERNNRGGGGRNSAGRGRGRYDRSRSGDKEGNSTQGPSSAEGGSRSRSSTAGPESAPTADRGNSPERIKPAVVPSTE